MKKFFLTLFCFCLISCNGTDSGTDKQLPWMIKSTQAGETEVLGLSPGNFSLREFAEHFHELAEVRLFQKADGKLFLEAYLGKIRIGKFDARLVAELDAPEALLHSILKLGKDRKPTPNGYWQYNLNDQYLLDALEQRVWRFMYIPIADYEEKQIAFFGVPGLVEKVTDTAEYRYYPEKGLVVLWDKEGKETFYYSSPKEFERLKLAIEADKKPEAKQPKAEGMAGE